ncbi:MAG: hypothetical protein H7832_15085 [Magnetococcus sp. DMHC-6]
MKTTRILAICGLFALLAVGNAQAATTGEFNGHTYTYVGQKMTWDDAKMYCESIGAHLVTSTSQEENDFIYNLGVENLSAGFFIGASDAESLGTWKWITGEPWSYTNWSHRSGALEPSGNEFYAVIGYDYFRLGGDWVDVCDKLNCSAAFICESEPVPLTVPHSFTPSTTIKSSEVNENFDTIYQKYNELLQRLIVLENK